MRPIFYLILLISTAAAGQEKIIAATENGKPYITKTVAAGESLFSLGRSFSIAPKELAAFNKLDKNIGLQLGKAIKIPLTKANLFVTPCTVCKKVFYTVPPKEGLYRIAASFNNMELPTLKKINKLTTDNVNIGQEILVGYLKDTEAQAIAIAPAKTAIQKPVAVIPVAVKEAIKEVTPPKKEMVKKAEPEATIVKEPILDASAKVVNTATPQILKSAFSSQFSSTAIHSVTGKSAIFKSTSGWNDDKFYVLMNNVAAGTIVKITTKATNKTLFAKVLGELPAMKQNEFLLLSISNAAATALGSSEEDMQVVVTY